MICSVQINILAGIATRLSGSGTCVEYTLRFMIAKHIFVRDSDIVDYIVIFYVHTYQTTSRYTTTQAYSKESFLISYLVVVRIYTRCQTTST
jgi:hypothetical protein